MGTEELRKPPVTGPETRTGRLQFFWHPVPVQSPSSPPKPHHLLSLTTNVQKIARKQDTVRWQKPTFQFHLHITPQHKHHRPAAPPSSRHTSFTCLCPHPRQNCRHQHHSPACLAALSVPQCPPTHLPGVGSSTPHCQTTSHIQLIVTHTYS